ncbi:unnamed protein product [Macrosiphum euphorbiae]|uniref:BED-type domain-containing protein n=1 Tax=Macrosiphum euphorbiae TaxID=13131 RepID=A0AAV0WBB5_9HEMI|nr:unnamed protein product [Macrosiphum euphorbiae]
MSDSEEYSVSQSSSMFLSVPTPSHPPPPRSIDGKFFKILNEKSLENKIVVQCVKCEPKIVELKGYGNSSSNFVTHLKR